MAKANHVSNIVVDRLNDRLEKLGNVGFRPNVIGVAIVLRTKQDTRGNPRKMVLLYDALTTDLLAVVKCGYVGPDAVIEKLRECSKMLCINHLCCIDVMPAEYNGTACLAKQMFSALTEL